MRLSIIFKCGVLLFSVLEKFSGIFPLFWRKLLYGFLSLSGTERLSDRTSPGCPISGAGVG